MKKIILILLTISFLFGDNTLNLKDMNEKNLILENNVFKIIEFEKRITDLRVSKKNFVSITFEEKSKIPFSKIKLLTKKLGNVNALITFSDKSIIQLNINITSDIRNIKDIIHNIDENVDIIEINNSIILKGHVQNNVYKNKIFNILKETMPKHKVVDLLKTIEPDKMVRLKLYVTEINNTKGEQFKNNWKFGFADGNTDIDFGSEMLNSVTLSGGLTLAANVLGSKFKPGWTLNYLKTNGVAKVLDETTLITLENNDSNFLAGGTLYVETSSTSAEGQPVTELKELNYGLEMNINVKNIINDEYIELEIDTSSSTLDKTNIINGIPGKNDKSIKTKVVLKDQNTLILGGLINRNNMENFEKIPLLGDIPVLGKLFQSKSFLEGDSELIFFITPTIINNPSVSELKKD